MTVIQDGLAASSGVSLGDRMAALLDGEFSYGLSGFSEDVVWHSEGENGAWVQRRGREAVLELIGRLVTHLERTRPMSHRLLCTQDDYVVEWVEILSRSDGLVRGCPVVTRLESGKIREIWWCAQRPGR